jgi:hypothetical protein
MSNIQDSEDRGIMIFAWWMAVLADGYSSTYFRKKPMLCVFAFSLSFRWKSTNLLNGLLDILHRDDDDYDIDFYTAASITPPDPSDTQKPTSSREHLEVRVIYPR